MENITEAELLDALKSTSPFYEELSPKWQKTRIVYKGEDAVHEAGTLLLPQLEQQTKEDYDAYVERTRFLNAFKRTVTGLKGTVERREPEKTEGLDELDEFASDVDLAGTDLEEYLSNILDEGLTVGVCATLVDHNDDRIGDDELSIAQVEALNLRPKLSFYYVESILKIDYGVINGRKAIILVVLKEQHNVRKNEFVVNKYDQYRVLRINDEGYYEQQLYRLDEHNKLTVLDPIMPMMGNAKMSFIPFFVHGKYKEPPLYDLVTTNIKHYQLKADHNHALHYVGLPTPYITGVDPKDKNLPNAIGPTTLWKIENDKAKVGYLELEGKGLSNIVTELDTIKEEMAFLGAAILVSDQMVNETATKANLRNASETASLADLVTVLSNSITLMLKAFGEWAGKDTSDWEFKYNTDFDINKLSAQEILYLVQCWQSGAFSKSSLFLQLKKGEIELVGDTLEDEEERRATEGV